MIGGKTGAVICLSSSARPAAALTVQGPCMSRHQLQRRLVCAHPHPVPAPAGGSRSANVPGLARPPGTFHYSRRRPVFSVPRAPANLVWRPPGSSTTAACAVAAPAADLHQRRAYEEGRSSAPRRRNRLPRARRRSAMRARGPAHPHSAKHREELRGVKGSPFLI